MNTQENNTNYRSFIAFELPEEIEDICNSIQVKLKKSGVIGKWTRQGNHHLTINFLGNQEYNKLLEIKNNIAKQTFSLEKIKLKVKGLSYFGKPPKVLFIKIIDKNKNADKTVRIIEETNNLTKNHKTWIPHLTLARFRNNRESMTLKRDLLNEEFSLEFSPKKITVFKSTLTPNGPVYEEI